MRIAVVIKPSPDLEELRYDPTDFTSSASRTKLLLSPFDMRAVLLAHSFRGPGDEVDVIAMGPPAAETALREALALGADRASLLCDPLLAGSDSSVTAHVLAEALRPRDPQVVLAGRFSTDASTGQVPCQIASLLPCNMAHGVRNLARVAPNYLDATAEDEEGWGLYRLWLPALVTVSEKACKARRPTEAELAAAREKPLERLTVADLRLRPEDVGLGGSRTRVARVEAVSPHRSGEVFSQGTPAERTAAALRRVRELLPQRRPHAGGPLPPRAEEGPATGEVLVLASREMGGLDPDALALVSEVWRVSPDLRPSVVGFGPLSDPERMALGRAGASLAYWPELLGGTSAPSASRVAVLLESLVFGRSRVVGVLGLGKVWPREVLARAASRLRCGLTGDAVAMSWSETEGLVFQKPSFGSSALATVVSRGRPAMATVRPGVWSAGSPEGVRGVLEVRDPGIELPDDTLELLRRGREVDDRWGDANRSPLVFGVGMGLGSAEQVQKVVGMVRSLGAAVVATRKVVDAGWVPPQLQVGLTGRSIAPPLYVALGASGRPNHLSGVRRAGVILGVNPEPAAPIFPASDVGILGAWEEVLPSLVEGLRGLLPAE